MAQSPLVRMLGRWTRKLHRWGSIACALPLLLVICTGTLLLLKKQIAWVQPPERRGVATEPAIGLEELLAAARNAAGPEIAGWRDIDRIDVRIAEGVAKVVTHDRWEVQIDTGTGEVLLAAVRRSDLIESLHDGSWFHPWAKLGVFLPSALVLLSLWMTGMYLWVLPHAVSWGRRRRPRPARA